MNTISKILTTTAIATLLPLGAMAANDGELIDTGVENTGAEDQVQQDDKDTVVTTATGESQQPVYGNEAGAKVTADDAGTTAMSTSAVSPDAMKISEADFDAYLADAKLVDGILENSLVVSSDDKLIGNVNEVYEKPNGQLMALITVDQQLNVNAQRALVPVSMIEDSGNLMMDDDYAAVRRGLVNEEGEENIDSKMD
ncbi:hypothetical protein [Pseudooceanicola sp. HF7]|uniref:hypothetical protein n=1 Tax=Pseudooceanicola sp. HF7 TaxID=2721560 RepID=UPI001431B30D|nr:hypothetical protein [Pseudooceanicola sp. HF7]NIZ11569.1 hypothetical protein [Pseudooceanicola sp. HF7]